MTIVMTVTEAQMIYDKWCAGKKRKTLGEKGINWNFFKGVIDKRRPQHIPRKVWDTYTYTHRFQIIESEES